MLSWITINIVLSRSVTSEEGQELLQQQSLQWKQHPIPLKRLEFVHITKTGGSAIEKLAAVNNIRWGACHFINSEKLNCDHTHHVPWRELYIGTAWHAPPKVINALVPKEKNPYFGADLFAVVRNPYDRAVSEYHCRYFGMGGAKDNDDPVVMNKWIQNMIRELEEHPLEYYYKSPELKKYPSKKHYVNQVEYIYDNDGTALIQNVLHYENLHQEFYQLMKKYNLKLTLPKKERNGVNISSKGKLTYMDLSDESIECINRYAAADFKGLGYVMVQKMDVHYSLKPQ